MQQRQAEDMLLSQDDGLENDRAVYGSPQIEQEGDRWASIVEPVTKDTLIDTVMAQLATLTTFCSILNHCTIPALFPSTLLSWVEEYSSALLQHKLPAYIQGILDYDDRRGEEIALAKANFLSALLEAGYRSAQLDAGTFRAQRDALFEGSNLRSKESPTTLLANAVSLMSFNTALAETETSKPDPRSLGPLRWDALTAAFTSVNKASQLTMPITSASGSELSAAQLHFLRAEISLLQYRLSLSPISVSSAIANAVQLLINAEIFYRNVTKLSSEPVKRNIANFRASAARLLLTLYQESERPDDLMNLGKAQFLQWIGAANPEANQGWLKEQLDDMVDDGLVPELQG